MKKTYTIYTTKGDKYYVRGVSEVIQKDGIITMLDEDGDVLAAFSLANSNIDILMW